MQATRKPNSVLGDHSSRRIIADALQQPTRRFRPGTAKAAPSPRLSVPGRYASDGLRRSRRVPAYLVLLRVGFTKPPTLLPARCALTAPFHPYLQQLAPLQAVCFLLHWPSSRLNATVPDVIRHTALWSSDFPPPRHHHRVSAAIARPPAPLKSTADAALCVLSMSSWNSGSAKNVDHLNHVDPSKTEGGSRDLAGTLRMPAGDIYGNKGSISDCTAIAVG